jgi:hypothetical protein
MLTWSHLHPAAFRMCRTPAVIARIRIAIAAVVATIIDLRDI